MFDETYYKGSDLHMCRSYYEWWWRNTKAKDQNWPTKSSAAYWPLVFVAYATITAIKAVEYIAPDSTTVIITGVRDDGSWALLKAFWDHHILHATRAIVTHDKLQHTWEERNQRTSANDVSNQCQNEVSRYPWVQFWCKNNSFGCDLCNNMYRAKSHD